MTLRYQPLLTLLFVGLQLMLSCRSGEPASRAQCQEILDRIVALELKEQGYRDPELARRKAAELRNRFASALDDCEGRRLPPSAMDCLRSAKTAEAVSHRCLRPE